MNQRVPKLRKHARGLWFCHWGGKDHYFGRDHDAAQQAYLKSLQDWAKWRENRNRQRFPPISQSKMVAEIADAFLQAKELEGGLDLRRYYVKHLARFLITFGDARAELIRVAHLQALKDEMLKADYAPKTINHDIVAVKGLFRWASAQQHIPPVDLSGVKTCALGPPSVKGLPIATILSMVMGAPEELAAWLAINYLALMRPTEVIRVVHRQGEWVEPGVFRLDRGKIDKSARSARHVCFSPEALKWLERCDPVWSRLDSYSAAVRREFGNGGPHPLRHSAARHLAQLAVARADIDLLLGHAPSRVSLTYAPIVWQPLRRTAGRLTLRRALRGLS